MQPTASTGVQTQPAATPPAGMPTTGYNPALLAALTQPAYLQGVAGYDPSFASYDPAQWNQAQGAHAHAAQLHNPLLQSLSPQATIAQLQQSMVPQTQQAFSQLQQQLADFGVQGGQGIMAGQQLSGQLEGSLAPAMASAIQNAQANSLGAGEFDVNALNNMRQFNASNRIGVNEFNAGQQNQMGLANSQNALQAALSNAGFANQAGQFNATNQNAASQYNVGEQNAYNEMLMQAILGNYNTQMGDIYGMGSNLQQGLTQQGLNYGQEVTQNPGLFGMVSGLAGAALPFFTGGFGGGGGGSYPSTQTIQGAIGPTPSI